jgi:hypothetical protein
MAYLAFAATDEENEKKTQKSHQLHIENSTVFSAIVCFRNLLKNCPFFGYTCVSRN